MRALAAGMVVSHAERLLSFKHSTPMHTMHCASQSAQAVGFEARLKVLPEPVPAGEIALTTCLVRVSRWACSACVREHGAHNSCGGSAPNQVHFMAMQGPQHRPPQARPCDACRAHGHTSGCDDKCHSEFSPPSGGTFDISGGPLTDTFSTLTPFTMATQAGEAWVGLLVPCTSCGKPCMAMSRVVNVLTHTLSAGNLRLRPINCLCNMPTMPPLVQLRDIYHRCDLCFGWACSACLCLPGPPDSTGSACAVASAISTCNTIGGIHTPHDLDHRSVLHIT